MTVAEKEAPPINALWLKLSRTDPAETKSFKRAGGFSGTAIKPMWVWQRLTEHFGPCGVGWGMNEPTFQTVPGDNRELLVYCTVSGWYNDDTNASMPVFGVGGDKVITHIKANEQYKRPERWENDDEAFKKAYTDALMNAFKFIGVGADVHMGRFDDNKYVQEVAREFAPEPEKPKRQAPPPLQGPIKTRAELRTACKGFVDELHACADESMLGPVLVAGRPLIDQVREEHELFWKGDGQEFNGLEREIELAKLRCAPDGEQHPWAGG